MKRKSSYSYKVKLEPAVEETPSPKPRETESIQRDRRGLDYETAKKSPTHRYETAAEVLLVGHLSRKGKAQ